MSSITVKKFTDNLILGLKVKETRYTVTCNGLELRVSPTGTKSWSFMYKYDGKLNRLSFGKYPLISLAAANNLVFEARKTLALGLNPSVQKEVIKQQNAALLNVGQLITKFMNEHVRKKLAPVTIKQYEFELNSHVGTVWGSRPVNSITRADAIRLLEGMVAMGQNSASRRIKANLSKMWLFALDRGIVENMPFVRLPEPTHATPNINSRSTRAILKLMLLLGRRGTEVVAATWDQVDLEAGIWHMMPAKIRQHHRATTVALDIPLPPLALQIFKERRAVQSMWEHVFPSEYNSLKSQSVHSVRQAVLRNMEVMGFSNSWTPHDLRRTTATHLGRLNYDQEQIDRIMGHKIQGVAGIYNRHSYVNQRLDALTKWDSEVQRIISGPAPALSK